MKISNFKTQISKEHQQFQNLIRLGHLIFGFHLSFGFNI